MAKWILTLVIALCYSGIVLTGDGSWSAWSNWSPCSATCGPGSRRRYRSCDNPPPTGGGKWCPGSMRQSVRCAENSQCPVNGAWTEWTPWSPCSTTCGEGIRQRGRLCTNPEPSFGGKPCEGPSEESEFCKNLKDCPRDGGWSVWSAESPCSVTCGVGSTERNRLCNNPPPAADGKPCSGKFRIVKKCETNIPCPVNGHWSEWSDWSACSASCGAGQRRRVRSCDNPPAQNGGAPCNDTEQGHIEVVECSGSFERCPVDGAWSEWSEYGPCETTDCHEEQAISYAFRHRSCNNPLPENEGTMCDGSFYDAGICTDPTNCKRDGGWSEWSNWVCTETLAKRIRTCDSPAPSNGGQPCPAEGAAEFFTRDADLSSFNSACGIESEEEEVPLYEDAKSTTVDDYYFED